MTYFILLLCNITAVVMDTEHVVVGDMAVVGNTEHAVVWEAA